MGKLLKKHLGFFNNPTIIKIVIVIIKEKKYWEQEEDRDKRSVSEVSIVTSPDSYRGLNVFVFYFRGVLNGAKHMRAKFHEDKMLSCKLHIFNIY
jgi:hypothetical protein